MRREAGAMKSMKVREVIQLIEADGWYLDRQRGSHRQYKHQTKRGVVTIPGKLSSELDRRTLDSIFHQAQIPRPSQHGGKE